MSTKSYAVERRFGEDRTMIASNLTKEEALDSLSIGVNFFKEHELYLIEADFVTKSFKIYDYMGIRKLRQ